jgi:hypothetical protein
MIKLSTSASSISLMLPGKAGIMLRDCPAFRGVF